MTSLTRRDIATPLGPLTLVADEGRLVGAYFADHRRRPALDEVPERASGVLDDAARAFGAYFAGDAADVPGEPSVRGTDFQRQVWAALAAIPAGETRTYGQIADAIGRPTAVRAVAAAIGANPMTIAVPCHRVVGSDGSLTGYAGGVDRKRWLLDHERHGFSRAR